MNRSKGKRANTHREQLFEDLVYVLMSVIIAYLAVRIGIVNGVVGMLDGYAVLGIFVSGMFFTSIFTTAPAIVLLGGFAQQNSLFAVIMIGAVGAAIGDYFIFRFMRDRVADDVEYVVHATHEERLFSVFHKRIFRWFVPFIGALVIASPFPDEIGIAMLGLSKTKSRNFFFISLLCNAVGIAIIGLVAGNVTL